MRASVDNDTRPLEDRALLIEIARALVDRPEDVHVEADTEEHSHVHTLRLDVHPSDRGKVIGRDGRTISALRQLFSTIGAIDGRQLIVEIVG